MAMQCFLLSSSCSGSSKAKDESTKHDLHTNHKHYFDKSSHEVFQVLILFIWRLDTKKLNHWYIGESTLEQGAGFNDAAPIPECIQKLIMNRVKKMRTGM